MAHCRRCLAMAEDRATALRSRRLGGVSGRCLGWAFWLDYWLGRRLGGRFGRCFGLVCHLERPAPPWPAAVAGPLAQLFDQERPLVSPPRAPSRRPPVQAYPAWLIFAPGRRPSARPAFGLRGGVRVIAPVASLRRFSARCGEAIVLGAGLLRVRALWMGVLWVPLLCACGTGPRLPIARAMTDTAIAGNQSGSCPHDPQIPLRCKVHVHPTFERASCLYGSPQLQKKICCN